MKITDIMMMVDVVMLEDTKQGDMKKKHHGKWHGDKKYKKRDYDDYDDHDWDHDDD
jgi:cytochrome b subunit of formate dehydrogenase